MVIRALKEEITQPNSKLHAVKCGKNPWVKIFFFFFSNNACCKWKKKVLYVNSYIIYCLLSWTTIICKIVSDVNDITNSKLFLIVLYRTCFVAL
jgi:hypothetical protein